MLFNSLGFLIFLPLALLWVGVSSPGMRWVGLLLASWIFYGFAHPANLVYLGVVTLAVLAGAELLRRLPDGPARRAVLAVGLAGVLGSLFAFKFHDFLAGEIERLLAPHLELALPRLGVVAPAGYSFYAFSAASLLIDAFARRVPLPAHPGHLALYLAHFPKVLAGPIERATTFLPQVEGGLRADPGQVVLGLQLVLWGLFKKVVIADNLAPMVDKTFGIVAFASPLDLLLGCYFFAFQIYCDFSGYTDIAIGVSLLFGVQLMENFRRPYLALSTAEFWGERWHISLGHWFRDYLYRPLGGSRAGVLRTYLNLMLVFLVSGLWHAGLGYGVGWTFLAWGALNGAYQWAGLATRPLWRRAGARLPGVAASTAWRALRVLFTFHLVAISWIFFRAKSVDDAWTVLTRIATKLANLPSLISTYPYSAAQFGGIALILLLLAIEWLDERRSIFARLAAAPVALRWSVWYLVIVLLLVLGRWQSREFIYMQF